MSTPYVGEIRLFAGNFAPVDWAFCDGSLIAISTNPTLFNLIGTTYGGDGTTTFALPDLRSRVPLHVGQSTGTSTYVIGETGGAESIAPTTNQIASHTHSVAQYCSNADPTTNRPANAIPARGGYYKQPSVTTTTSFGSALTTSSVGSGTAHENRQPFLALNFIIALFGVYPSQS